MYKPTGFPRGRPRAGEIRPDSINAIQMANYRARRHLRQPQWKEHLAELQRNWRKRNPERSKQIARSRYYRKQAFREHMEFLEA